MDLRYFVAPALLAATAFSGAASAAVVIKPLGSSPIDPTAQVHNNNSPDGFSILAETKPGALGVTFSSNNALLHANGNGHSKISAVGGTGFHDITIKGTDANTLFTAVEFNLQGANNLYAEILMTYADGLTSKITSGKLDNGQNKLVVYDDANAAFKSIEITGWRDQLGRTVDSFAKFDDIRQIDVNGYSNTGGGGGGAVPEPATWALMIIGFGMIGSAMRRQQQIVRFSYA